MPILVLGEFSTLQILEYVVLYRLSNVTNLEHSCAR